MDPQASRLLSPVPSHAFKQLKQVSANLQAVPFLPHSAYSRTGGCREWVTPISLPWLSSAGPPLSIHPTSPPITRGRQHPSKPRSTRWHQNPSKSPLDAPGKSNAARARSRHTGKGCVEDQPPRPRSTVSTPHLVGHLQLTQNQPARSNLTALAGLLRHLATFVFFRICHNGVNCDWRCRCRRGGRSRAQLLDWQRWSSQPRPEESVSPSRLCPPSWPPPCH